jgi:DNA-directed RNA polymerase subunit alpha
MVQPVFNVITAKQDGAYSEFVLEPLERGYGHTVGNALRRVLLSSLPGHAISMVKVKGVDHAFTTLPGVTEDVVDLLLNIKEIRVRSVHTEPSTLTLSVKGGEAKASDIECPGGVEIVNPEHHIATLAEGTKLELEFTVTAGVGYSPAQERETTDVLGELAVDALYSPIDKVAYDIEQTRVGRRTDYDKLVLKIWTNGTVVAKEALDQSAQILIAHFQQVVNPTNVVIKSDAPVVRQVNEVERLTIEELDLPTRIANALRKGGYNTVGDLMRATRSQVAVVKNLGGKSVELVEEAMAKVGATFRQEEAQQ